MKAISACKVLVFVCLNSISVVAAFLPPKVALEAISVGSDGGKKKNVFATEPCCPSSLLKLGVDLATTNNRQQLSAQRNEEEQGDRAAGLLVLLTVPFAWGTYSPVVKYMYDIEPAIPGLVFSMAYYIVASTVLNGLSLAEKRSSSISSRNTSTSIQGGLELGLYLFIANALQVRGLVTVPAERAGFLVQLTTVIVPLLSGSVSLRTWVACLLAFAGVIVMGLDGNENILADNMSTVTTSLTQGDLLIVAAAVLYSFHVVRLSRYATETTPLELAASKATTEAFLSVGCVSGLFILSGRGGGVGEEVATFVEALTTGISSGTVTLTTLLPAIGAVFWTGLVTCAYTIYAQSYGQARVSPTEANLIYTVQPLFTAVFGYFLLGETLGPAGGVGAILITLAVFAVANDNNFDDDEEVNAMDETSGDSLLIEGLQKAEKRGLNPTVAQVVEDTAFSKSIER